MKRFLILFLLLFLTACGPNEDPPITTGCEQGQIEIDGECLTLSGSEQQLYNTLTNMNTQDNYVIEVTVTDSTDNEPTFILQFDGSTSSYQDDVETIYYTNDNGTCTTTIKRYDSVSSDTTDCVTSTSITFIDEFRYDMFTLSSGVYVLNDNQLPSFQTMIDDFLTDATVHQVSLQIANDRIDRLTIDVGVDSNNYTIIFQFKQYGSVSITLPSE